jgi:hypothetical protein
MSWLKITQLFLDFSNIRLRIAHAEKRTKGKEKEKKNVKESIG